MITNSEEITLHIWLSIWWNNIRSKEWAVKLLCTKNRYCFEKFRNKIFKSDWSWHFWWVHLIFYIFKKHDMHGTIYTFFISQLNSSIQITDLIKANIIKSANYWIDIKETKKYFYKLKGCHFLTVRKGVQW